MKRFEYAQPQSEREAVALLTDDKIETAVLAGGTDLVGLMKRMVVTPDRVVAALAPGATSPEIPDWIAAWIAAEAKRPWPPT